MYVTSSVTTFMDKMHLIGELSKSAFTVNLPAKEEYQRLRKESLLEPLQVMSAAEFTLTISVWILDPWESMLLIYWQIKSYYPITFSF